MFIARQVSLDVIRALRAIVESLERVDKSLADQVRRAASSAALNVCEGAKRAGKDRAHFYRVAAGSCAEVRAAIAVSTAWGYLGGIDTVPIDSLLDRQAALLHRLAHKR